MAVSLITDYPVRLSQSAAAASRLNRRRRITPHAGHALEILGHAIDYLTDEFVHHGGAANSELEAVQLLMALNRQVYFECPEVPTMGERLRSVFHLRKAA